MDLADLASLVPGPSLPSVELTGKGTFASAFDVDRGVFTAAAAANSALGEPSLSRARCLALCKGQALIDGQSVPVWADLSGYYGTRGGGFIQFHCNFPHHTAGVVRELGCAPTRESVQSAVLARDPEELESALVAKGMIAARLRTLDQWNAHPHAAATADLPVVSVERIGEGLPRDPERRLRVLDSSRVLAGPVAGLMFAAHGADVLRVGSEQLPSVPVCVLTTGSGKRNAFLELDTPGGAMKMRRLLDGADVWIDAYRPGALAARGFTLGSMAPGSVAVQLSAFDWVGPWAGRRGFDSIVQSTTGIVRAGSSAAGVESPTPLPVQALDYCTGLLAAFTAARLAQHQAVAGGTWLARLSLLRTRNWLMRMGGPHAFAATPVVPQPTEMQTTATPFGAVTTAKPISGHWPHGPQPLGSSPPAWLPHPRR